jgi:adenine-specific DNA-methyltransferase
VPRRAEGLRLNGVVARGSQKARDNRLLVVRRKIGAFYTPETLSQVLSDWAIRSPDDTILEPSFGGCGFLECAQRRLLSIGCGEPREQIYGCDIDTVAFDYLADIFKGPVDLGRFLQADFLDVRPGGDWPATFPVVLANPPYIPYQELGTERRKALGRTKWPIDGLGGRSSLWAYFITHTISFLEEGGRMAWVLPGSFLQADYAIPIRNFLAGNFRRVAAILIRERIFLKAGADEETVILLADGFRTSPVSGQIEVGQVETLQRLTELIALWEKGQWSGNMAEGRPAALSLSCPEHRLLVDIAASTSCKVFGDLASVQIGLVTGANEFFVLSNEGVQDAGLENSDCTPILAKFAAAPGITFTLTDHQRFLASGGRGHLVDSHGEMPSGRISAYLERFTVERRAKTSTFRKRKIWSKTDDGRVPDAFFPVMHHWGPRLVLNPYGLTNTNTIHRVYFREPQPKYTRQLIAISLLTSYSQLSAELVGRRYGSGVLKHEPREAEQIRLLLPATDPHAVGKAFIAIDRALRANDRAGAMQRADTLVYSAAGIGEWKETSARLTIALEHVRQRRRPQRAASGLKDRAEQGRTVP